jgi:hypothetical protein
VTRSTVLPTCVGSSSGTSKARTPASASSGSYNNCKQQLGESLREYIRRFSKRCTDLPGATDNDAILAFQNSTTCTSLIH